MFNFSAQSSNPNSSATPDPSSSLQQPPPTNGGGGGGGGLLSIPRRPPVRVTSEFDSDGAVFLHKISCKLFEGLAKLKLSFQNNNKGQLFDHQLSFTSKYLSLHYDFEEQNALVKSALDLASGLQLRAEHDVKAQQGEVSMVADIAGPAYKLELTSAVPSIGLPKATLRFPLGEVSLEEREEEEEETKGKLSINGILNSQILDGICTAEYRDENLNLRYAYKDEQMAFIPSISLPSNVFSFAFKRRFGPSDKLSYLYNFDSNDWSAVYKHTIGENYKLKAGYDSEVRLGWASLWVGDEYGSAKAASMKMKVQFMLQVPQDDIRSSALMFRVKKRWDV